MSSALRNERGDARVAFCIAFDFPEGGEPWFATMLDGAPGLTSALANAKRFETETAAERFLALTYGDVTGHYGAVVEVEQ